jgi:hypothetical protein
VAMAAVRAGGAVMAAVVVQKGRWRRGVVAARGGRSGDPRVAWQALHHGRDAELRAAHGSGAGGGSPN